MIAAEPAAAGDSRGWIAGGANPEIARERDWLPGRCGLLPHSVLRSRSGRRPTVAVADSKPRGVGSATGFGKCGTRFERCSGWSGHSPPSGEKLEQEFTYECGSGGWPGPHFFVVFISAWSS